MIDPTLSLALSMHSSKRIYAVLLGSGVSTAAGIPTGWGIVKGLVTKLAKAKGEDCGNDWERWYKDKFGQEPAYDQLISSP